ncbi:MAG: hypothetical protein HRK26_01060 [Rickettsiaceae bacterium H1]|nr:hypothetical protein [Rickettsiaceae bacterium H1]
MEAGEKKLQTLLNDSRYFTEAWDWYADKYLKPSIEKMWLIVLAIISAIIFAIHVFAVNTFFPLSKSVPFVMYVDGNSDDLHVIKKLTDSKNVDPQVALAKYLVTNYVKTHEKYDYNNIEQQKSYIKANSSRLVYDAFLNQLDITQNPDSPLLKYKKEGKLNVDVLNVEIYGTGSSNAKVQFITYDNITHTKKQHSIMLRFTLSNIVSSVLKLVLLEFRVVSYGK